MDVDPFLYQYIIFFILLLLSAFFSGSETAIFSLDRLERNSLLNTRKKGMRRILQKLIGQQDKLLITILTGNMIVNIFASSLGEAIGARLFPGNTEILSIAVMTTLLLLVGELTPKRFAVNHAKGFTRFIAYPLLFFHHFFTPLRVVFSRVSRGIINLLPGSTIDSTEHKHALVLSTAELGFNQSILNRSEYRLFKSYLLFKEKLAHSVMTPRKELKTVESDMPIHKVLTMLEGEPDLIINSSLILHKGDIDHLHGWVQISDLLKYKFVEVSDTEPVSLLSRQFHVVPESKRLTELIPEMRSSNQEVVLLVDEYGGTAGLLWFRNIIEDVLRAFYAPFKETFDAISDTSVPVHGSMTIGEFEDFFNCRIETAAHTVAGLFLELHGDIPAIGARKHFRKYELKVTALEGNRISELLVTELEGGNKE
jgi:CBS domain containing-hemolysin-like protein